MNIPRLLAYFEECGGAPRAGGRRLEFDARGACAHYGELRLFSVFQPLVDAGDGKTRAHEALLRARNAHGAHLAPDAAFALQETPAAVAELDRLCRMLHTANFAQRGERRGDLFLNVDFRHLLNSDAEDRGRAFETWLRHCGLASTHIVLEVLESRIDDLARLEEAILAYRRRGFRVAIDDFGAQDSNFDRLWRLTPDIVKIDRNLLLEATVNPRARRILPKIVDIIHDLGAKVVCEGIETYLQDALARDAGADLLQGFLYGRPAALAVEASGEHQASLVLRTA